MSGVRGDGRLHPKAAVFHQWDGGEGGRLLVLGGILTLLSPLVVPAFVVLGIGVRVIEAVIDDNRSPPAIEDWAETTLDGGKAAVVVVYVLVPTAVGAVVPVAVLGFGRGVPTPGSLVAVGGLAVVYGLVLGALVLAVFYAAPAALVHLARTRRLGAAFAFADVRALAAADGYASAWLLALVVFAANGVVLAVLSVTSVAVILNGFVSFYAFLAMAYLYGRGGSAAGFGVESAPRPSDVPDGGDAS